MSERPGGGPIPDPDRALIPVLIQVHSANHNGDALTIRTDLGIGRGNKAGEVGWLHDVLSRFDSRNLVGVDYRSVIQRMTAMTDQPHQLNPGRTEGLAAALGAAGILLASGFEDDSLAFSLIALLTPLLAWGLVGLRRIHRDVSTRSMTAGYWVAQLGVLLIGGGFAVAAVAAATANDDLSDLASLVGIAPGFLIAMPIGLGLFGFVAWRGSVMGKWRRLLPSLTAAAGVIAPQFLLFGFIILGYAMWDFSRRPAPPAD